MIASFQGKKAIMKNDRQDIRKYIGAGYQTYFKSYSFLLPYFDESNLLLKIDLDVFDALIPFFANVSFYYIFLL
jgi:hypothetical protein